MSDILHPEFAVVWLIAFVCLRWIDAFGKSAASEAGKSFGKKLGDTYARKAKDRFGLTSTPGLIVVGIVTVLAVLGGLGLAIASPDCENQKTGFILASGTLGIWS